MSAALLLLYENHTTLRVTTRYFIVKRKYLIEIERTPSASSTRDILFFNPLTNKSMLEFMNFVTTKYCNNKTKFSDLHIK